MKNKRFIFAIGGAMLFALMFYYYHAFKSPIQTSHRYPPDEALLAIIKSDLKGFRNFLRQDGDLHSSLPMIDDKIFSIIEGVVHFERMNFIEQLQKQKIPFLRQDLTKDYDLVSIAVEKNNLELLKLLLKEKPNLGRLYGRAGNGLLHLATQNCSPQIVQLLHSQGLNWTISNREGSNAITFAAEKECLPVLNYWKEKGADFKKQDNHGKSPLGILKNKKDMNIVAFVKTFDIERKIASVPSSKVNFYQKRKVPIESGPADRPIETYETSEYSEFAD